MFKVIYESTSNKLHARNFKTPEAAVKFVEKISKNPLAKRVYPIVDNR